MAGNRINAKPNLTALASATGLDLLLIEALTTGANTSDPSVNTYTTKNIFLKDFLTAIGHSNANKIINGEMRIDQRNAGASISAGAGVFPVDRWYQNQSGSMTGTMQQLSTSLPVGLNWYLRYTATNANTPTGTQFSYLAQRIEGLNTADLNWGTVNAKSITVSMWIRSSLTGDFGFSLGHGAGSTTYPFLLTITVANTWTYVQKTIPGDTVATWAKDNTTSLVLQFCPGVGTTYKGTANAWSGSNLVGTTGQVMLTSTNGATFDMTGVKVESGSIATPFVVDDYAVSLAKCTRYFQSLSFVNNIVAGAAMTTTQALFGLQFTPMRAAPTVTLPATGTGVGQMYLQALGVNQSGGTFVADSQTINGIRIYNNGSTLTAGNALMLEANTSIIKLDSEL